MPENKLFYLTSISDEIENYNAQKGVLDKLLTLNKITKAIDDYFNHSNDLRRKKYETLSAKFAFHPQKTKEAIAESIIKSNTAEHVSFRKNTNIDAMNIFGDCASRVYSRFNVKRPVHQFGVKGAANEQPTAMKYNCKAIACYASKRTTINNEKYGLPSLDEIALNNVKCSNAYVAKMALARKEQTEHYKDAMVKLVLSRRHVSPTVKELAPKVKDYAYNVGISLKDIFTHELGHLIDHHNTLKFSKIKTTGFASGWAYLLSKYATSSASEYFAEAFCLYMNYQDQHWRLEPQLLALLKKMDLAENEIY
ncbi:hypothetical protein VXS06_14875 [Photobacterium toruni]|uniref:Uncharacterized protein n=1 Tax=Photobacterium toruni TaxID=1935446 RepID=A0ABU6LBN9_9GAMM|nr:hypothetical protein [Photobacterium toruni]